MPGLVLNRRPQQRIFIFHPEGKITITILDVTGPNVRLRIDAPLSVAVERDDIHKRPPEQRGTCDKCGAETASVTDGNCWRCFKQEQED